MEADIHFPARPYQQEVIDYFFKQGGKKSVCIWHRKAGKDRTATFIESKLACERVGLYWHALPRYEDCRKVVWDAITSDGKRLIDISFPKEIVKKRLDHEMKIELFNGSIWQPVGADNYDSLVGAFPCHITWSEYAIMGPNARNYLRPALALNNGSEIIITTTRGYNHAFDLYQHALQSKDWHTSMLTVDDTKIIPQDVLDEEKSTMPDELFRQEYYCDWSASNVGAILGRYVEAAEKDGRIKDFKYDNTPVVISSDIGYRDTCAWWFWVPKRGGFDLIDYSEGRGLDASEWIPRLQEKGYPIKFIWLPQDAKVKTFQSRHSSMEQFIRAFGNDKVGIVPATKKRDQINAARTVISKCRFHRTNCKEGLLGLREWAFKYDEVKKLYSKEPDHNWASHPSDGFAYGAIIMQEQVMELKKERDRSLSVFTNTATINDMWQDTPKTTNWRI